MARPTKPTETCIRARTEEEIQARKEQEEKLKGSSDKIKPPTYLSKNANKIFKGVVKELEVPNILGNVDIYLLEQFSNTYVNYRNAQVDYDKEIDFDRKRKLEKSIKTFSDPLPRLYNELGLSPSSRVKLGTMNIKKDEDEKDIVLQYMDRF
ncbi:P27 family phage terminase, small subunit [Clostridioides difficile]|uniref:phage terminase small subunit P27 family n=1 Tax=Clostridioides difficile TaxID=1496 RepID=UPI000D1F1350|nr:phage terminase small subunit P27 family [Clostridioides difficile]UWD40700.1 phage terminase small subunit P27 family [Clostridioides difficile]UWD44486.1 phage terminase small subunit P27 family [Clostridioides difficile]VFF94736.1 P27 family phage terminase, small subunit [Clostridioides difficile]VIG11094.1 P27 family phage terminase, small subunit [Clostridioides difficile]HBE9438114.1 phage terminase small subunit P27 family [Clostridioides difficile]